MNVQVTPTNIFIANAVTNSLKDPLKNFDMQRDTLDFNEENLWAFFSVKALEQNSNCRALAMKMIKEKIIPIHEILPKAAIFNYIQLLPIKTQFEETEASINQFMKWFDQTIKIKNDIVEEMMEYDEVILNNCSEQQLLDLCKFLEDSNLGSFIPQIPALKNIQLATA